MVENEKIYRDRPRPGGVGRGVGGEGGVHVRPSERNSRPRRVTDNEARKSFATSFVYSDNDDELTSENFYLFFFCHYYFSFSLL